MTKCDFMTERLNIPTDEDEKMKKLIEQGYTKIESEPGQVTGFRIVHDNVNYPSHYQGNYGLESIDVLRNFMTNCHHHLEIASLWTFQTMIYRFRR